MNPTKFICILIIVIALISIVHAFDEIQWNMMMEKPPITIDDKEVKKAIAVMIAIIIISSIIFCGCCCFCACCTAFIECLSMLSSILIIVFIAFVIVIAPFAAFGSLPKLIKTERKTHWRYQYFVA